MEFKSVLRDRRSIRSYSDKPVDSATVQALIASAVLAPSAINSQPWEFWAVLGREGVDQLSDRAKAWLTEKLAHDPTAAAVHRRQHLAPSDFSLLYHAPALVLIVATSSEEQADEDCCLAAGAFMLAARDADIGSCWIGSARSWFNQPDIKKEFGIPLTYRVVAPIVLGYPLQWPEFNGREEPKVHWL